MKLRTRPLWPADSVQSKTHASVDWLISCERGVAASDLARQLEMTEATLFDVSALEWLDEGTVLRDLTDAVGGPNVHAHNWNALRDGLADLPDPSLVVVRDIDPRHEPWIGTFVAIFDPTGSTSAGQRVLALEGWGHADVEDITPTAWRADIYQVRQVR